MTFAEAVRAKMGGKIPDDMQPLVDSISTAMEDVVKERVKSSEDVYTKAIETELRKHLGEGLKTKDGKDVTFVEALREMGVQMDALKMQSQKRLSNMEKYQLRSMLEKRKEDIIKARNAENPTEVKVMFSAVRAASLMTTQNVITGVATTTGVPIEIDDEIVFIRYPQNFILDMIRNRQVNNVPEVIRRREQDTVEGAAAMVAEGAVKPLMSYTFSDKLTNRVKYAAHIEFTEELERDFEQLLDAIIDLFERDVMRAWQEGLLQTIIATAVPYTTTGLDGTITRPDNYSAIAAAVLAIQNMNYQPDVIWLNQTDVWGMQLTQGTDGHYVLPPIMVGNREIAGMRLYVSNLIPVGKMLIGDSTTWKEQHTGFITRVGLINDQLIRNEKTIVGEVYSLLYQADADKASWLYGDFAAIKASLQAP